MSNYRTKAINPATGEFEECTMLDDYFGKHKYGVNFDDDDIYKEEEVDFNMPQDNQPKLDPEIEKRFDKEITHLFNSMAIDLLMLNKDGGIHKEYSQKAMKLLAQEIVRVRNQTLDEAIEMLEKMIKRHGCTCNNMGMAGSRLHSTACMLNKSLNDERNEALNEIQSKLKNMKEK